MQVKKIDGEWMMLVSYWDVGWVLLNVDDPTNPTFVDDYDYPDPDPLTGFSPPEGNAHQAWWSKDNRFVLGTDEDFAPARIDTMAITDGPNAGEHPASAVPGGDSPDSLPDGRMNGPTVYGGYGCDASAPVPPRSDYAPIASAPARRRSSFSSVAQSRIQEPPRRLVSQERRPRMASTRAGTLCSWSIDTPGVQLPTSHSAARVTSQPNR